MAIKQAHVVALLQQKGGSGKTTTAVNLIGGLLELGCDAIIADMDKDKPDAWSWAAKNDALKDRVFQVDEKNSREQIAQFKQKHDIIIIDTPPNFQTAALKAALLSDLVIIPAAPSGMDLSGLLEAKELAMTANRPYLLLANRIVKNTNMGESLLSVLREDGHTFDTFIPQSIKFVEAETRGRYIGDFAPQSHLHVQVRRLAKEVISYFAEQNAPVQETME